MVRRTDRDSKTSLWLIAGGGNLQEFLSLYSELAEAEKTEVIRSQEALLKPILPYSKHVSELFAELKELIAGGKKLRGGLVVAGFSMSHGEERLREAATRASIGFELLHNAFLVHDDIMDQGTLRRHRTAAWRRFSKMSASYDEHYGMSQAINLVDMIAFFGPALIADRRFPGKRVSHAIGILALAVQMTVAGQMLDVETDATVTGLQVDHVLTIARYKTAFYSFVAPLQIGAALAGVTREDPRLSAMEAFGIPLGIAFQLHDDILGIYGTEEELGKSTTSDLAEGKKTLFFVELCQRLQQHDKEHLDCLWGNADVDSHDLAWVRQKGHETRALEAVQEHATALVNKSKKAIPMLSNDLRARRLLEELAGFVVHRVA